MLPPEIDGYQTRLLQSTKNELILGLISIPKKNFIFGKKNIAI